MLCKGSPILFSFLQGSLPSLWASLFSGYLSMKKSDSTVLFFCRCYVISHLPSLVMLDDHAITGEEREEARKVYGNRRVSGSSRRASKKHKEKVRLLKSLPFKNYMWWYDLGWILQSTEWQIIVRGRSRGRVQSICKPPWDDVWLSNTTAWYSVLKLVYVTSQLNYSIPLVHPLLRTILDTPLIVITECRGFSLICFANG